MVPTAPSGSSPQPQLVVLLPLALPSATGPMRPPLQDLLEVLAVEGCWPRRHTAPALLGGELLLALPLAWQKRHVLHPLVLAELLLHSPHKEHRHRLGVGVEGPLVGVVLPGGAGPINQRHQYCTRGLLGGGGSEAADGPAGAVAAARPAGPISSMACCASAGSDTCEPKQRDQWERRGG